jgi:hypothetical protein
MTTGYLRNPDQSRPRLCRPTQDMTGLPDCLALGRLTRKYFKIWSRRWALIAVGRLRIGGVGKPLGSQISPKRSCSAPS